MTAALAHYKRLTSPETCAERMAVLSGDAKNCYYTNLLKVIPAGTTLRLEYAGDFGCYAIADISGVLHNVRVGIDDLHKIVFLPEFGQVLS